MIFRPITSREAIQEGKAYETLVVDFKERYALGKPTIKFDIAKDIAAFANAFGGSIIVGAIHEAATNTLTELCGIDDDSALEQMTAQAVARRCRPLPLWTLERFPVGNEKVLCVINVEPHTTQMVGVLNADQSDIPNRECLWHCFPLRIGSHTTYIAPEELPMYMLPDVRRNIILLNAISQGSKICVRYPYQHGESSDKKEGTEIQIHEEHNYFELVNHNDLNMCGKFPIDGIRSVWNGKHGWNIWMKFWCF